MTDKFEITPNQPEMQQKETPSRSPDPNARRISRLYFFSTVVLLIAIIDSIIQFEQFDFAWQILADALGMLIGLILLRVSHRFYKRGNRTISDSLIPVVVFIAYAPGDLFLEGVTIYNILSGLLILLLAGYIFKPQNRIYWIISGIIFTAAVIIFSQLNVFDERFDISLSPSWEISLPVFTIMISLILIWQIILSLQLTTIRARLLVAFVLIGLIPAVIAAASTSILGVQQSRQDTVEYLSAVEAFKMSQIEIWLESVEASLLDVANKEGFIRNVNYLINPTFTPVPSLAATISPVAYSSVLDDLNESILVTGAFNTLFVMDSEGLVIVATESNIEQQNYRSDEIFIKGLENYYQSPMTIYTQSEDVGIFVSLPLYSPSGSIIGVLAGEVKMQPLISILSDTSRLGDTGEIYLVNLNNILFSKTKTLETLRPGLSKLNSTEISQLVKAQSPGWNTYSNYADESVIGVVNWIPPLGVAMVTEQNQTEAFQGLRLNLFINAAITIATIGLAVSVSFVIARSISNPISTLANTAKQMASGEVTQIPPLNRVDEIGSLSLVLSQTTSQLRDNVSQLEQIVADRTADLSRRAKYLEATAEIGRAATSIHDLDSLLSNTTHHISEKFGFYHVGVFMLDDNKEYAELKAANSEGGWRMLARGHKLRVGEQGIVGYVTGMGKPRIQQQVEGEDSVYYDNPDLPLTRSEMALPLIVGGELLGALDVQSTVENAFAEEDVSVLQVLADEVAIAINNAKMFQQLQESVESERRVFGEVSREAWVSILQQTSQSRSYRSDSSGIRIVYDEISPLSQQAISRALIVKPTHSEDGKYYPLSIPIKIHGDIVVAVIETQKPVEKGPWSVQEVETLEAISEQLGIALENARLFEETQRLAQRERIAADVAGRIWSSTDIDTILQTAVQEIGKALNVSQGTIKLSIPEEDQPNEQEMDEIGEASP